MGGCHDRNPAKKNQVDVNVYGEFTLADYKEFEDMVNYTVKFEGPVSLFFDLREMADFTLDVAWEDVVFSRAHADDFERVAVLTNSQWVAWSTWLSRMFVKADIQVFSDAAEAHAWVAAGASAK